MPALVQGAGSEQCCGEAAPCCQSSSSHRRLNPRHGAGYAPCFIHHGLPGLPPWDPCCESEAGTMARSTCDRCTTGALEDQPQEHLQEETCKGDGHMVATSQFNILQPRETFSQYSSYLQRQFKQNVGANCSVAATRACATCAKLHGFATVLTSHNLYMIREKQWIMD